MSCSPAWSLAMEGGTPRESDFEDKQSLIAGIPQDWGKQKLHFWREHTRCSAHQDPGKKAVTWVRLNLLRLEGLLMRWGAAVAHCWDKDTGSNTSMKYSLVWALLETVILSLRTGPTKQPVGSSAGMPQAKQTTVWEHNPQPSTDRLLKVFLSTQLPAKHNLDTALHVQEGQDPAPPTSGQEQVLPTRKPAQAS